MGEGLTSCVYKAIKRHKSWGIEQTVALKILKSKDLVPTFAQEVHALSQVDSLHCVKFYDWIEDQKTPVLVLEHLDGVTLEECLRKTRLSQSIAAEIVAQAQAGLRDLHKNQLKHGDLSPKNIFITQQGVVKLLDFGFCQQKKVSAGTLAYMAPECWDQQEQTEASDLFSLGIIQHEMVTGERVYTRHQAEQRMKALQNICPLLMKDKSQRHFLILETSPQRREELAKMIKSLKNSLLESVQTTFLAKSNTFKAPSFKTPWWVASFLMGMIQMYSYALHPATLHKKETSVFQLDVRSFRWAEVELYQIHKNQRVFIKKQYTPFMQKTLPQGHYQIEWSMPPRRGLISVHLNKNRRILLQ